MTQLFSIICICYCLTMLSVTKDYVYITSSQQIAEHEMRVEVVGVKLLSQHLPGETQRNNEATSVSQYERPGFESATSQTGVRIDSFSQTC